MLRLNKEAYFNEIGYSPHPGQQPYHDSKARFRVPVAGRRFGKSMMSAKDKEPTVFKPKMRGWIVGPTYDLAEKEFRVFWDDLIIKLQLGKDKRVKRAYNLRAGEMYIEFPWGARVEARSAAHPDKLVGEALDWVIMSEAAKHTRETWERYIRPALSDKRGGADFPTTPEGYNWLYKLWLLGQNDDLPEYESWRMPSWLNTVMFPGGRQDPEILLMERTADSIEWFMQEVAADFASFVGRIYGEFDEQIHVRNHTFNPAWPSYGTWDFGFSAPLAFVEFQISPSEDIYVWREHYKSQQTLEEHLEEIKNRPNPPGYHLDLMFGDAADPEAVETINQKMGPCIADPESKSNWRQGINLVKRYLKQYHDGTSYDDFERPVTQPKYFVDHSCVNHIKEMLNYRVKDNANSNQESNSTGVANKMDDHTLDAMRYGMMHAIELGYGGSLDAARFLRHKTTNRPDDPDTSALWVPRDSDLATVGFQPVTSKMRL